MVQGKHFIAPPPPHNPPWSFCPYLYHDLVLLLKSSILNCPAGMQWRGKQGPAQVAFGGAEANLRLRQSLCFEGKESQRQNSTAPGNGTFSRKGTHRSSEVKFRERSQQPGGKEAVMNACLPALSAFHFLNTSPASASLSGQQRTSEAPSSPRHSGFGLTDLAEVLKGHRYKTV